MIRLLIADDEISACNDMIRCINWDKYGIEIIGVAGDGPETYRMIQSCRPDIVLIDIQMPGMSGIEVIKQIRGAEEPHPSFIIVSGYDDFSYAQQAIELDVDQYLLKPFLPTQLLKAVHHSAEKLEIVRQRGAFLGFSELWQGDTISLSYPAKEERQVIRAIQSGSDEELDSALETFWAAASVSSANGNAMLFSIFLLSIAVLHLLFDCGVSQLPSPSLQPAAEGEESRLASLRRQSAAAEQAHGGLSPGPAGARLYCGALPRGSESGRRGTGDLCKRLLPQRLLSPDDGHGICGVYPPYPH